jgi:hypothetical protein
MLDVVTVALVILGNKFLCGDIIRDLAAESVGRVAGELPDRS